MHNPEMLRMKCLTGHMVETVIVNEIMKSYDNNCVEGGSITTATRRGTRWTW